MDIGDILIMIFIVSGILSSLAGGKKKKKKPQSRPLPRPDRPPGRERARAGAGTRPKPSLDPSQSGPIPTQMEEILRQLGLEVEPETEAREIEEPEIVVKPEVREVVRHETVRELPRAVPLARPARRIAPSGEARHTKFHDEYIDAFEQTRIERPPSRAKLLLTPRSLRQAMLLKEILGTPKGL